MNPRFYFATCQVGAEKAVKAEIASECPHLRFAFSRPGFITFKEESDKAPLSTVKKSIFTRLWGTVLAQTKETEKLKDLLSLIPAHAVVQCFDRDEFVPGDEPNSFTRNSRIHSILKDFDNYDFEGKAKPGDEVYSLVWIDDFHVFLVRHTHTERLADGAGNIPTIPLPENSPSRAYLKIEEALYRFKPVYEKNNTVLEVGCAPGGATTALLDHGLRVTGIDPQFMDATVSSRQGFSFIRKPARFVTAEDLKNTNPVWLVMDMSIAPNEALTELSHVITILRSNFGKELKLRQGFLTIKLNDWKFAAEIPSYLKRIEQMGFHYLHPIQLCSNRQEFFIWASRFK